MIYLVNGDGFLSNRPGKGRKVPEVTAVTVFGHGVGR